jgi:hypothetical protein
MNKPKKIIGDNVERIEKRKSVGNPKLKASLGIPGPKCEDKETES